MKIEDDFGFTIEQIEIPTVPEDTRAQEMYDTIIPLINNLMQNPEIDTIKWPNREKKLEAFKKKLTKILKG